MSERFNHNSDKVIFANTGLEKEPVKTGLAILL